MASRHKITVPKNAEADDRFTYGQVIEDDLIQWWLTEEEFRILWEGGIFLLVNEVANAWLDDHEEETIYKPQKIRKAIAALESKDFSKHPRLQGLVEKLTTLFKETLQRKVTIYFWF